MKLKVYKHLIKALPILLLIFTTWANTLEGQIIINGSMTGTANTAALPTGWTRPYGFTSDICSTALPTYGFPSNDIYGLTSIVTPSVSPNGGTWVGIVDNTSENEAIGQTITGLTIGKTYTIAFYVANFGVKKYTTGETVYGNPGYVKVYIDGVEVASSSYRPVSTGWELVKGNFVATATSAALILNTERIGNLITYMAVDGASVILCNAGNAAPTVNTSVSNICPATTVNLSTQAHTGTAPPGSSLVWFTNNTHTGTAYTTPTTAAAGIYYAFYYDSFAGCYSPASIAVTVANTACLPCPTVAPNLNNTTAYSNSSSYYQIQCGGSTLANLSALTASNMPSGSVITWHTGSVATSANMVSAANAVSGTNTYYAAFYNASGNCYSPTKMVTVLAPICAVDDDFTATPIIAGVGGTLPSIFGNDTYNGTIISTLPANSVLFAYELWPTLTVTVDANGNVHIPASMPAGDYTLYLYKICDKDPDIDVSTNCSSAEIKFKVIAASVGCYKPGMGGTGLPTKHGISALGRAGADNGNWPMVRESAWTALESKTKGFVPNRIATTALVNAIPNPVEGMMVYDNEADCLKIYSVKEGVFGWYCFSTPACAVNCIYEPGYPECQSGEGSKNSNNNKKITLKKDIKK